MDECCVSYGTFLFSEIISVKLEKEKEGKKNILFLLFFFFLLLMVNVSISFGSLNVRGIKDIVKRKALFLFCKGQKCHCLFLQETHSCQADVNFWANQWGDKMIFSHGSNRSGGVAICFNRYPGEIITHEADVEGHWLAVVLKNESLFFIIVNVYGYNNDNQNKKLLQNITDLIAELKIRFPTEYILVGGDWNMAPDEWDDRWPPRLGRLQCNGIVADFATDNNLTDVWRKLNPGVKSYSWFKPNNDNKSRIDYWMVSDCVLQYTSQSNIAKAPLSDHCYIDITIEPLEKVYRNKGYWKFNAHLLYKEDYCNMIRQLIKEIENDVGIEDNMKKWEFAKFRIREYTIKFSKDLNRKKREYESKLF